jgi:large subunit ribosomal protein L41
MKPTQALLKRVARHALSTKQANKGFYKGTGSGSTGRHTQHGGYIIEWHKVRTYVVPKNLKDFKVWRLVMGKRCGLWILTAL